MLDNTFKNLRLNLDALVKNLTSVIRGKDGCIEILVIALLAEGSVLMEDVPGTGKTTLAKTLAKSIDLDFRRVQFTPDLLPGDILGTSIYNPVDGTFRFREGPLFCNVLLGDEINRASPRTQSALLEAMSEAQATIEGNTHPLPSPFMVIATQNPVDFHGTYPLPEAQLDRFLVHLRLGYPDPTAEVAILYAQAMAHPLASIKPVLSVEDLRSMQQLVRTVRIDQSVTSYLIELVGKTRDDPRVKLGVSPRGSLMLFRAAQASAVTEGRDFVLPDDVQRLAPFVLPHRIILTSKAKYTGVTKEHVIADILQQVRVPT